MPFLKNAPNIHRYRNDQAEHIDLTEVNQEILAHGADLPQGQLLYRGGNFTAVDMTLDDGPVSTTLMPSVALWHARAVRGQIAVFTVADDKTRAFVYNASRAQKLGHEFEVLLRDNIALTFIDGHDFSGVQVFRYDIRAIDS